MSRQVREAEIHRLIAGDPALDFANTLNGHARRGGHEYLHDFRDLALWCRHAGLLSPREARRVQQDAAAHPVAAGRLFRKSVALRESIFRVFHAFAVGATPSLKDVEDLNAAWRDGQRHVTIAASSGGFSVAWDDGALLERIPRTLSAAAVNALISGKGSRVKACAGQGCDWLFLDTSRNHLRRWCSMDECGNRAKMRRRQQRKQLARSRRGSQPRKQARNVA